MRPSLNCTNTQDDLKAYADRELSRLRVWAVRRHLTHCASCREEIAQMTQITEDLRTSEPEEALSPALRERILGSPLAPNNGGTGKATSSSDSPIIGGRGASSRRKRPVLAWGLTGVALIAWFVCYPLFGKVHENARFVTPAATAHDAHSFRDYSQTPTVTASSQVMPAASVPRVLDRAGSTDSLSATGDPATLRQVHKEASIGVQVADPEAAGDTINTMVQETGGYVAANNLSTDPNGLKSGELVDKVPVTQFETFLAQVAKLGVVQSKNISGEDITEQTSDADQTERVYEDDLQQSEARLKALGSKAKWHDEQATRDLRIQLAQAQARLVLLKRMARLGTITIDLSQTPKAAAPPPVTNGFTGSLKATTHDALQSLVGSAGALLALVIWLLAYAPIWVPLLLLGRYALKEYRKREAM